MQIYSRNFSRTTTHRLYEWLFFCISYIYKTANESYKLSTSICSNICPKSIYPTCPPLAKLPNRANESSATSAAEAMAGDEQIYVSVYTILHFSTHPSSNHRSPRLSRDVWQQQWPNNLPFLLRPCVSKCQTTLLQTLAHRLTFFNSIRLCNLSDVTITPSAVVLFVFRNEQIK